MSKTLHRSTGQPSPEPGGSQPLCSSDIKEDLSQTSRAKIEQRSECECHKNHPRATRGHHVSNCRWENGADRAVTRGPRDPTAAEARAVKAGCTPAGSLPRAAGTRDSEPDAQKQTTASTESLPSPPRAAWALPRPRPRPGHAPGPAPARGPAPRRHSPTSSLANLTSRRAT